MQDIIRSEFKDHTVIMIVHRLSNLLEFDHVAVMDGGRLVEFGKPIELLAVTAGWFSRLYGAQAK